MNHQLFSFGFKLPPGFRVKFSDHQIQAGNGEVLAVSGDDHAIRFISLSRFPTRGEAQSALEVTIQGLSILGVLIGYGIADFQSFAGDEDAPGPLQGFWLTQQLDGSELGLERAIRLLNSHPSIAEKYRLAAEMFDNSCFVQDQAVAVVLRTTGLEILTTREPVGQDCLDAIGGLVTCLGDFAVDDSVKDILRNALMREKKESISRAVQRHVLSIVPEADAETIREIYAVRSKIVHGERVDSRRVSDAAKNAKTALRLTILHELGFSMPAARSRN